MPIPTRTLLVLLPLLTIGAYAHPKRTSLPPAVASSSFARHSFAVSGQQFLMDGKPYQIISGEMHYTRIPKEYWRDRLRKARAMGLNTITTYVFWNVHEPRPGVFDFSGQNDIGEFIREAEAAGLNVILRPGPYVCAEWELGGYPSWLLKDRNLILRSTEPKYTAAVGAWFARLAQEITPLLLKNGGPIIAVQVENEYGAFGDDRAYLEGVKKQLIKAGLGDTVLYTSNQAVDILKGSLPELPTSVNFGTGGAKVAFGKLEELRPNGPHMAGEFWAGWFDKWGEAHHETDGKEEARELRWMLERGYSVSIYMFDGGTSFGWMNGADSHTGTDYHPDTTSYDYDAPLDEAGDPRDKFFLFRTVIEDVTHTKLSRIPKSSSAASFPVSQPSLSASLWHNLPTPVVSRELLTFEDLDQSYGYVLYRTWLDEGDGGPLVLHGLHDYAQVYIDQALIGVLDRRLGTTTLQIPPQTHASTLDILVENTGRVNYSQIIRTERAGLTGKVTIGDKAPKSWEIYSLPMNNLSHLRMLPEPCSGPCFYKSEINASDPADTYLDTRSLHKGQLWIGTHNLGRFWSVGPQYTLYLPGCWLQRGTTPIVLFDLQGNSSDHVRSVNKPIVGVTTKTRDKQ